ncbi:hypothetical protein HanRHA438_Chr13g0624821 [Helianthus annuus]|nr:hypothetical protein HanRHA438_Chr13g0624821 [Helianthus annuus]
MALTYFQLAAEDHEWWWRRWCGGGMVVVEALELQRSRNKEKGEGWGGMGWDGSHFLLILYN